MFVCPGCKKEVEESERFSHQCIDLTVPLNTILKIENDQFRRDDWYTYLIIVNQLGSIARYIQHDEKHNPQAIPIGSKKDEMCQLGETLIHILRLGLERGFDLQECIDLGLDRLASIDWARVKKKEGEPLKGRPIKYNGSKEVRGRVFLLDEHGNKDLISKEHILVCAHFKIEDTPYFQRAKAIVTDHGGITCHAARVAEEHNDKEGVEPVAVIVGTGTATKTLKHGRNIVLNMVTGEIEVVIE